MLIELETYKGWIIDAHRIGNETTFHGYKDVDFEVYKRRCLSAYGDSLEDLQRRIDIQESAPVGTIYDWIGLSDPQEAAYVNSKGETIYYKD